MGIKKGGMIHQAGDTLKGSRWWASQLHNIILGGQDGVVNVFGLVVGVAAGTNDFKATIIAGLAGTFAESISMAAVGYTSTKAAYHYYEGERARESKYVETVPRIERKEVRDIYYSKGFRGELLDKIVAHITKNKKLWVDIMMADELGLSRDGHDRAGTSAAVIGLSAVVGSFIPLLPFFFLQPSAAIPYVAVGSTLALFCTGALAARLTSGSWWRNGLQMALVGMTAAIVGYLIGWWLGVVL